MNRKNIFLRFFVLVAIVAIFAPLTHSEQDWWCIDLGITCEDVFLCMSDFEPEYVSECIFKCYEYGYGWVRHACPMK
jgi:hypothetical protein